MSYPAAIPREDLAKFLPNHRAVRAFEQLIRGVSTTLPNQINVIIGDTTLLREDLDALTEAFNDYLASLNVTSLSINSNRTTGGNEFLIATAELTVTLNATPANGERVSVLHDAGSGVNIYVTDGSGIDVLSVDETIVSYCYSEFLGIWVRGA